METSSNAQCCRLFTQYSWSRTPYGIYFCSTCISKIYFLLVSKVSWGKKALLVGGKTEPGNERVAGQYSTFSIDTVLLLFCKLIFVVLAVWAFDTETECWSLMEAKGDIPVQFYILSTLSQFKC